MIEKVEIVIKNGLQESINALILYSKNIAYINNKKYQITEDFKKELQTTIYSWKNEYGSDSNIDSEEFTMTIHTNKKKEIFHGKGIFPHNYQYLKELLGDIND